jgi:hypothetical protein
VNPIHKAIDTARGCRALARRPMSFRNDAAPKRTTHEEKSMSSSSSIEGAAISASFTGTPAWKNVPSWALVSRWDQMILPDAERFMAQRAHAHVVIAVNKTICS